MSDILASGDIRERLFAKKAFKLFFIPAFLSNLGLALGGVVDCLVVGSKMGDDGLTAIALGIPIYLFYNIISYGFSIGGSIHYSSKLASGHPEEAESIFNNIIRFVFIFYIVTVSIGLLFLPQLLRFLGITPDAGSVYDICYRYVRAQLICVPVLYCQGPFFYFVNADGSPRRAAVALVISNTVDIIMNYILVIRVGMSAEGSVWSTVIGAFFCLGICGKHILSKDTTLHFKWVKFSKSQLLDSFKTGFSSSIQYLYQFIAVLVANKILMQHGGIPLVAVFDVIYNLSLLSACVSDSLGMVIQPMVSTFKAEKNYKGVSVTVQQTIITSLIIATVEMLLLIFLSKQLCSFFGLSGISLSIGAKAVIFFSLSILPSVINQCAVYYNQTTGREGKAFLIESVRLFFCWLPLAVILCMINIDMFWVVYPASELVAIVIVAVFCVEYMHNDWAESSERVYSSLVDSNTDIGKEVEHFQSICEEWDCSMQQSYYGTLVLEEICAAIIADARRLGNNDCLIQFTVIKEDEGLSLFLRDNLVKFNPFELSFEPEDEDINVLGMDIVKKKAKEFYYRRYIGFNTLVVRL